MLFLDKNPQLCAKSTPCGFLSHIIESITDGYNRAIKNPKQPVSKDILPLSDLVYKDITFSKSNADWYKDYFLYVQSMYKKIHTDYTPLIPDMSIILRKCSCEYMTMPFKLHSPLQDLFYQDIIRQNSARYSLVKDQLMLSRLILIDLRPQFEDFIEGAPHWLTENDTEVITAYDYFNKRHIKIEKHPTEDRYRYFMAIISNNWKEVENVPPEMDIIVNYLISNRANLALADKC